MKIFSNKKIVLIIISIIFGISLSLRIYKLDSVPKSMHNDEVTNTYAGRFILENGQDVWGNKFPLLYMDKFGDYPPVLPMYVSAAGTYLFGTNEFGSRIGIAWFGALFVIPLFFLVQLIYGEVLISIIISVIACILPWHFILSRANSEGIVALTIYACGLLIFLKLILQELRGIKYIMYAIGGLLLFLVTYLIYPTYRIFIPSTMVGLLIYSFLIRRRVQSVILFSLFISIVLTLSIAQTTWGNNRFTQTSIFNEGSGVQIQIDGINFNEPSIISARIFNNKPLIFTLKYISQYLDYFSPNYLFINGGYPRTNSVPYSGLVYISMLGIFVLAQLISSRKISHKQTHPIKILIIYLLLTAPIASAFTYLDAPNNHRSLPMVLPLLLMMGLPMKKILLYNNKIINISVVSLVLFESIFFFHNYFWHANLIQSPYRNDGNKEAMKYVINNKDKYDKVFVTSGETWLPVDYLFFSNNYNVGLISKIKQFFWVNNIDRVYFSNERCVEKTALLYLSTHPKEKYLLINPEDCVTGDKFKEIEVIKRANFTTAFKIYKSVSN